MPSAILSTAQHSYPQPIADSVAELNHSVSLHEKRDRIIEVFRTTTRLLAAIAIGVRVQFGVGPEGESKTLSSLMAGLRRRGLTDGQWVSILRELLREYKGQSQAYPIPGMVKLFHVKKARYAKLSSELLDMRKSQTVAHGRVFKDEELKEIIAQRIPQLEELLSLLKPISTKLQRAKLQ